MLNNDKNTNMKLTKVPHNNPSLQLWSSENIGSKTSNSWSVTFAQNVFVIVSSFPHLCLRSIHWWFSHKRNPSCSYCFICSVIATHNVSAANRMWTLVKWPNLDIYAAWMLLLLSVWHHHFPTCQVTKPWHLCCLDVAPIFYLTSSFSTLSLLLMPASYFNSFSLKQRRLWLIISLE